MSGNHETLEEYALAARHALDRDRAMITKAPSFDLKNMLEIALNIRTNYAEAVLDTVTFLRTGTAPKRLARLLETYRNETGNQTSNLRPADSA